MSEATLIVPPIYEAQMVGVTAIKISTRKIYQCDATLRTIKSCRRKTTDDVAKMSFLDLVALVDTRHHLETQ
jgi:hypothetical protein